DNIGDGGAVRLSYSDLLCALRGSVSGEAEKSEQGNEDTDSGEAREQFVLRLVLAVLFVELLIEKEIFERMVGIKLRPLVRSEERRVGKVWRYSRARS